LKSLVPLEGDELEEYLAVQQRERETHAAQERAEQEAAAQQQQTERMLMDATMDEEATDGTAPNPFFTAGPAVAAAVLVPSGSRYACP
jgi:hypothetical protein